MLLNSFGICSDTEHSSEIMYDMDCDEDQDDAVFNNEDNRFTYRDMSTRASTYYSQMNFSYKITDS